MLRPLKSRIWFYKPGPWCPGFRLVKTGGDEFGWHTLVIGGRLSGAIVIAWRQCPQTSKCQGSDVYDWPIDGYGFNHLTERFEDEVDN